VLPPHLLSFPAAAKSTTQKHTRKPGAKSAKPPVEKKQEVCWSTTTLQFFGDRGNRDESKPPPRALIRRPPAIRQPPTLLTPKTFPAAPGRSDRRPFLPVESPMSAVAEWVGGEPWKKTFGCPPTSFDYSDHKLARAPVAPRSNVSPDCPPPVPCPGPRAEARHWWHECISAQ